MIVQGIDRVLSAKGENICTTCKHRNICVESKKIWFKNYKIIDCKYYRAEDDEEVRCDFCGRILKSDDEDVMLSLATADGSSITFCSECLPHIDVYTSDDAEDFWDR